MLLLVQSGSVPAYLDNLFLQVIRMPNVLFFSAEQIQTSFSITKIFQFISILATKYLSVTPIIVFISSQNSRFKFCWIIVYI